MNQPAGMPEPEEKGRWIVTLGKVLLWFIAIAVVLTVLVFGSCLLMMRRW